MFVAAGFGGYELTTIVDGRAVETVRSGVRRAVAVGVGQSDRGDAGGGPGRGLQAVAGVPRGGRRGRVEGDGGAEVRR